MRPGDFAPRSAEGYYALFPLRNETFHLGENEDPWDPLDGGMKDPSATIAVPLATHVDGAAGLSFVQVRSEARAPVMSRDKLPYRRLPHASIGTHRSALQT